MDNLPCVECCNMDESCCRNPQIAWTIIELDELVSSFGPEILEGRTIFKAEFPGGIYIIDKPPEDTPEVEIKYCTFYDQDNRRCSIYENRPAVCKTYGDPKYNCCPFQDFTTEGDLTSFLIKNPGASAAMHKSARSNTGNYLNDFLLPFVEKFMESEKENPEYMEWWRKLPEANFTRVPGL